MHFPHLMYDMSRIQLKISAILLSTCEFCKNQYREGRTFLIGVKELHLRMDSDMVRAPA